MRSLGVAWFRLYLYTIALRLEELRIQKSFSLASNQPHSDLAIHLKKTATVRPLRDSNSTKSTPIPNSQHYDQSRFGGHQLQFSNHSHCHRARRDRRGNCRSLASPWCFTILQPPAGTATTATARRRGRCSSPYPSSAGRVTSKPPTKPA